MSKVVRQVSIEYWCLSKGYSNTLEWPGYAILVSAFPGTGSLGYSTSDGRSSSFQHIRVFSTQVLFLRCVISSVLVLRVHSSVPTRLLA